MRLLIAGFFMASSCCLRRIVSPPPAPAVRPLPSAFGRAGKGTRFASHCSKKSRCGRALHLSAGAGMSVLSPAALGLYRAGTTSGSHAAGLPTRPKSWNKLVERRDRVA